MNVIRKPVKRVKRGLPPTLLLAAVVCCGAADRPIETNRFTVGVAAMVAKSPYCGADPYLIPVPLLAYRGSRFQLNGIRASYRLWQSPYAGLSGVAQWRFAAFEADDSPWLHGMQDRSHTVDAGLRLAGPRFLPLETGLEIRGDTLGVHDGVTASLDVGRRFTVQQGILRPGLRLEWLSPQLADYLYGVRREEALPDRPAYQPDSSFLASAETLWVRPFAARWEFTAMAGISFLDSAATGSPIVEGSPVWRTMAAVGYRF